MPLVISYKKSKNTTGNYIERYVSDHALDLGVASVEWSDTSAIADTIGSKFDTSLLCIDSSNHYIVGVNTHPKALWLIDTHVSYRCDRVMAKSFDILFVAQKDDAERLARENKRAVVKWLPLAGDPAFHGQTGAAKKYDVAFVGQFGFGERRDFLLALKERYPNSHIGLADSDKIGEIYSQARIVFNYSIKNDINMRIFEGMCAGSMVLTNPITGNGFDDLFTVGENIAVYTGKEDLFEKIDRYLADDTERERIAANGRQLVLAKHTYGARAEEMLSVMKALPSSSYRDRSRFGFFLLWCWLTAEVLFWRAYNQYRKIRNTHY